LLSYGWTGDTTTSPIDLIPPYFTPGVNLSEAGPTVVTGQ